MRCNKNILLSIFLLIIVTACNDQVEVNPSEQFIISDKNFPIIEQKLKEGDCDAFNEIMMHYRMGGNNTFDRRKYWLDYAMKKPMRECTGNESHLYANELLDIAKGAKINKYEYLMEAYRYANHGYDHAEESENSTELENARFAQNTINQINFELWKLRKDEFENTEPK
jgi:hypothetical protein